MSKLPNPLNQAPERLWEDFPCGQFSEECFRALSLIDLNREYLQSLPLPSQDSVQAAEALADIAVASNRLERSLAEMMALIRCVQGSVSPQWERVELCALLKALCAKQSQILEAIGVALSFDCGGLDNHFVYADYGFLETICLHLLSNALRACGRGGHVALTLEACGGETVLRVSDDGCGLPDETETSFQEKGARFLGGNRGGLLLCREYCRLLGWTLELKRRPGGGAEAVLRILPSARPLNMVELRSEDPWEKSQQEYRLRRLLARELRCVPGLEAVNFES